MKKRLVAILLSMTMCMTPMLEVGAAAFEDVAVTAETVESDLFTDSAEDAGVESETAPAAEMETPVVTEPETAAPEVSEEVTPTPEVQEEATLTPEMQEEVIPTPEVPEEMTPTPEEVTPAPENEDAPVLEDLFVSEPVEEVQEEVVVEEETENQMLLAVDDFTVTQENWEQVDGKWKLRRNSSMVEVTPSPTPEAEQSASADTLAADGEILTSEETVTGETVTEEAPVVEEVPESAPEPTVPAYFTAEDGIVKITTVYNSKSSVGFYYFDENGFMVVGNQIIKAGTPGFDYTSDQEMYFLDKVNLERDYGIEEGVEPTPYNSELGKLQKGKWMWTGETFRYYTSGGRFMGMAELKATRIKAKNYTGFYDTNNTASASYYCLDSNGKPQTGIIKITEGIAQGEYYFMDATRSGDGIPGKQLRSGWAKVKDSKGVDRWRYYKANGKFYDRGYAVTKLDATLDSSVGTDQYLLSSEGYILKSKMQKVGGYYYFSDNNGRIQKKGLVKYGKYRYYVDSKGRRVSWKNCWHRCPWENNRYYYFGKTAGRVVEKYGWQNIKVNGKFKGWYYFNKSGNHYISRFTVSGYYFEADGQLASGMTTVDGKKYYFEPSTSTSRKGKPYKKKWFTYNNKRYYASSKTYLCDDGWEKIKGKYYYFNSDGSVKTNTFMKRKGVNGYLDSTGKYTTGWIVVNNAKNQVRYVDPTGNDFARNKSLEIDGLTYYFDKNGYRINDVSDRVKGPYYLEVDRVNGVMTVFNKARTIPVKSIRVSVGTAATPTPTGTYTTHRANRWQLLMGPSWGQYATHVVGGILIHSVACSRASSYALPAGEYNKLGYPASHGCIRCCVADALWVYNNCDRIRIKIYDGKYVSNDALKGPLGKPALTPLYGSRTFDPTDPAV